MQRLRGQGIVSGVGRELATPGYRGVPIKNVIQTDAAINPGAAQSYAPTPGKDCPMALSGPDKQLCCYCKRSHHLRRAGNSGGVLLNSKGRLIGINTAIADPTGAAHLCL